MVVRIISSWSILTKLNEFDLEGNFVAAKWLIDAYNSNNQMGKLKLRRKELLALGYPKGKVIALAINMMLKHYPKRPKDEILELLKDVLENAETYQEEPVLGRIVRALNTETGPVQLEQELLDQPIPYQSYGLQHIGQGAQDQMDIAMRLPVTTAGALMPDAHQGYGLPIGGVLATENAVIPYGVGVDIGCRMCLSVYDISPSFLEHNRHQLKDMLKENTRFGKRVFDRPLEDEILDRQEFKEISIIRQLKKKAYDQLGSSGSGNHFVEFGVVEVKEHHDDLNLPPGQYLSILSHSGSRGLGAQIARHFTQIAMDKCYLPNEAKHLAWLGLDTEEGMEYWLAMNLAGDYASACHNQIHRRLGRALGESPICIVENHHNFAWKERLPDGREVIVHRKGATPAGKGVLGVIPGSMTAPGFIVRGKGSPMSINSASHGAGRQLSRRKARASITKNELKKILKAQGVELIGGGLDEAPTAYKDIHQVMRQQHQLVDVLGTFWPKIVRMDAG